MIFSPCAHNLAAARPIASSEHGDDGYCHETAHLTGIRYGRRAETSLSCSDNWAHREHACSDWLRRIDPGRRGVAADASTLFWRSWKEISPSAGDTRGLAYGAQLHAWSARTNAKGVLWPDRMHFNQLRSHDACARSQLPTLASFPSTIAARAISSDGIDGTASGLACLSQYRRNISTIAGA